MERPPPMKPYRIAYVTEQTHHSFEALERLCEEVRFLRVEKEPYDAFVVNMGQLIPQFDPNQDLLVPTGSTVASLLVGLMIGREFITWNLPLHIAVYNREDHQYRIITEEGHLV